MGGLRVCSYILLVSDNFNVFVNKHVDLTIYLCAVLLCLLEDIENTLADSHMLVTKLLINQIEFFPLIKNVASQHHIMI